MEFERREIYFAGQVQGVGFRYTTHRIAMHHDVTGFVKNLHDGRVLLVVEGKGDEIDALVSQLRQELGRNIDSMEVLQNEHLGEFDCFTIAR